MIRVSMDGMHEALELYRAKMYNDLFDRLAMNAAAIDLCCGVQGSYKYVIQAVKDGASVFLIDADGALLGVFVVRERQRRIEIEVVGKSICHANHVDEIVESFGDTNRKFYAEISPEHSYDFISSGFRKVGRLDGEQLLGSTAGYIVIVEKLPHSSAVLDEPTQEDSAEDDEEEIQESSPIIEPVSQPRKRKNIHDDDSGVIETVEITKESVPFKMPE